MKWLEIIDNLTMQLEKRLVEIEKRFRIFSELTPNRYTNEKLLQLETALLLSKMEKVDFVLPEKLYPGNESRKKVDIWFVTNENTQHWIELKMRPTSYQKGDHHSKAMTNSVNGIIEDYKKLQEGLPKDDLKHLIFFFFPIFKKSSRYFEKHLKRISRETKSKIERPRISVALEDIPGGRMEGFVVSFN